MGTDSKVPTSKVAATGLGSAAAIVLVAALKAAGVGISLELALAIVALAPPVAGYFKSEKRAPSSAPVILPPR